MNDGIRAAKYTMSRFITRNKLLCVWTLSCWAPLCHPHANMSLIFGTSNSHQPLDYTHIWIVKYKVILYKQRWYCSHSVTGSMTAMWRENVLIFNFHRQIKTNLHQPIRIWTIYSNWFTSLVEYMFKIWPKENLLFDK